MCRHTASCEFYFDIKASDFHRQYYYEAEQYDGYVRDRCVFGEDIDIYDTVSLNVKYGGGTLFSYSLKSYSPYEGWRATFTGTNGRIKAGEIYSGSKSGDDHQYIEVYGEAGGLVVEPSKKAGGGHGGRSRCGSCWARVSGSYRERNGSMAHVEFYKVHEINLSI